MDENPVTLVLRTCPADMVAKGEYTDAHGATKAYSMQWPRTGPVEASDWNPQPICGFGLHGLAWGEGDWSLLSAADDAVWQVVEVETALLVSLDGGKKVKYPRGYVLYSGDRGDAIIRVLCGKEAMANAMRAAEEWAKTSGNSSKAASSGNYSTAASSGDYSTAASSGDSSKAASSGDSSTAASSGDSSTAASSGDSSKAASSGDSSKAASSGDSSKAASSGDYSKAASSGNYSKAASSGNYSTAASSGNYSTAASSGNSGIAATLGTGGMAKAGTNGLLIVTYWVADEKRYRACVGNVGEGGVLADTWYRVTNGALEAVPS